MRSEGLGYLIGLLGGSLHLCLQGGWIITSLSAGNQRDILGCEGIGMLAYCNHVICKGVCIVISNQFESGSFIFFDVVLI